MNEQTIRNRCACGWVTTGPVDDVVRATIEHGRRVHNMLATREQVLERAETVDPGDEPPPKAGHPREARGA